MQYQQILAAVDTTEDSKQVLDAAQRLSRDHDAPLSLVTVVKPFMQVYGGIDTAAIADIERGAVDQATAALNERAESLGLDSDHVFVVRGTPAVEIRTLAREIEASVIVIGTHGRSGMGLMLLGSTANGVLHGTDCDVLAIRISQ